MAKTSSKNKTKTLDEIRKYWTNDRRANAIHKQIVLPSEFTDSSESNWESESKNPVITLPNTSIHDDNISQELVEGLAIPVTTPTEEPWRYNGKLFFTWKGEDYVGSAGAILNEILLTAGHNIYDEGEWSDNFLYYPAFPDYPGNVSWSWERVSVFTAWQFDANYAFDYAMIHTDRSMETVGSMGVARSISPIDRTWTAIGYPSELPYEGNQMYKTTGSYVGGNTVITMNNNDMTEGSSGGIWVTTIRGTKVGNGVQSHRYDISDNANSPYIDNDDYELLLACVTTDNCK